jgi:hypothetical protein
MIHEFRLSPLGKGGVSCDEGGAFVGAVPMLVRTRRHGRDEWRPRDCDVLSKEMSAQYGLPVDMSSKRGGLKAIANALNEGDMARAQVATLLLRIPNPPSLSKGAPSRQEMIKLAGELQWSGLLKADWDPDLHPRWPAGAPDSQGGQFAPKGDDEVGALPNSQGNRTGSDNSRSDGTLADARIHLADAGVSDASDDPMAQAAARASEEAQRNTSAETTAAGSEHGNLWQRLGAELSDGTKAFFAGIGRTQIKQSTADLVTDIRAVGEIAHAVRAYEEYRAQPLLSANGQPVLVPVISVADIFSDQTAMMGELSKPNPSRMRPATNADWINSLVDAASLASMAIAPEVKIAGSAAEAVESVDVAAISTDAAPYRATFGQALTNDYRRAFFDANPELKGQVFVHHAVPQKTLATYFDEVTEAEIHSLENLRGIPNELNSSLHLSQIAREPSKARPWNSPMGAIFSRYSFTLTSKDGANKLSSAPISSAEPPRRCWAATSSFPTDAHFPCPAAK